MNQTTHKEYLLNTQLNIMLRLILVLYPSLSLKLILRKHGGAIIVLHRYYLFIRSPKHHVSFYAIL